MNPKMKPYLLPALAALAVIFASGFVAGGLQQIPGAPGVNVGTVSAVAMAYGLYEIAKVAINQVLK